MNYTILVNRNNPFKEKYLEKLNIVKVSDEVSLEKETYNAYLKLKTYLEKLNIYIGITSKVRLWADIPHHTH